MLLSGAVGGGNKHKLTAEFFLLFFNFNGNKPESNILQLNRQNMAAFKNMTPLAQQRRIINKFAACVLKLFRIARNKFIFHASIALWLLLIKNTEWFPTSLPCTHTSSAAKMQLRDWTLWSVPLSQPFPF